MEVEISTWGVGGIRGGDYYEILTHGFSLRYCNSHQLHVHCLKESMRQQNRSKQESLLGFEFQEFSEEGKEVKCIYHQFGKMCNE